MKETTTKNKSVKSLGKRTSSFSLDPRDITVRKGFNGRIKFEGIEELAEDIKINGLMNPLKVRSINNTIELIDGERRLRALLLLADQGNVIDAPVTIVKKQVEEQELLIQQLSCNSGKPFTAYEKSLLYKRIKDAGIKPAEIARRSQTSKQAVSDALRVVEQASEAIQQAIQDESISFTLALSIIKDHADYPAQDDILKQTLQNAKNAGKDHASGKHLPKKHGTNVQENESSLNDPDEDESTNLTHPHWLDVESDDIMSYGLNEHNVFTLPNLIKFTDIPPSYKLKELSILYAWTSSGRLVMSYSYQSNTPDRTSITFLPQNQEEQSFPDLASALRATVPHISNLLLEENQNLSEAQVSDIFNLLNDIAPYKHWTFEKSSKGTGMNIVADICKDPCEVLTLTNIPEGHRIEHLVIELSNVFGNHSGISYKSRSRQKNIDCNIKERPAIASRPASYRSVWEQELEEIIQQDSTPIEFAQIKENLNLATHFISAVDKSNPNKKDISEEYKHIKSDDKPLSSSGSGGNSGGNSTGSMENKINNVEKMLEKVSDDPDFKTNDTVYASFEIFIDYMNGNHQTTKPLKDFLKQDK